MDQTKRLDVILSVEGWKGRRWQMLSELGIPRSTYYQWRKAYRQWGLWGLIKTPAARKRVWKRLAAGGKNH